MSRVEELSDDIRSEMKRIRDGGEPDSTVRSLTPNSGSVQTTVDKEAVRAAGHDPAAPGAVQQHWFRDMDIIVIDLREGAHGQSE